ncbi:benzyl alcohol O-benzoyltransferase [Lathyrus oleraceus]|uniref:benzyl alcohol O-benzoyltransferase n=1 Tax=Pisum sativum TaxID=3888 RepID=UPI0021CE3F1C|nr:benzyl alcohol O-benzoyltransferase-like [Pisum sativum]
MTQFLLFTMKRRAPKLVTPSNIHHLHLQYLNIPYHQKPLSSTAQSLLFTWKKPAPGLVTPSNKNHLRFQYLHIPYHQKPFSMMAKSLTFTVKRRAPELVTPLTPTPHEIKLLSAIDDQDGLRFHIPLIQFYNYDPNMKGKDPVDAIRKALAKTLVFYYPFAGRLREGAGRKLMVDCTGEGVLFIEADADDVTLKDFGDNPLPPFPFLDEVLYDVPGSSNVLNAPLMLIQVTRLKCGGFIFAIRINHTMSDAIGIAQFMNALAEICRGMNEPSISPVWCRELLSARNPPRVTCYHPELEQAPQYKGTVVSLNNMVRRTFFYGPNEVATIRSLLPANQQQQYSKLEIITAFLWRCRTIALQFDSNEEVHMNMVVNGRSKFVNLHIPNGYYGNVVAIPAAITTAGKIVENKSGYMYALNLVQNAKTKVTKEYMHSLADLIVIKSRPLSTMTELMFIVSDTTRLGFRDVDFGWGKAVYGGPAIDSPLPGILSFYIPFTNVKGEEGLVVPFCLPAQAMERFVIEHDSVFKGNSNQSANGDTN